MLTEYLNKLNPKQKEAVLQTEGPVMVIAGAGSGKTRVLTTRIAYIIKELGIPSSKILAVTFTNKAAREMKERVENMLNIDTTYMWISTFHAFCARLLRLEIKALGNFSSQFTILDTEDQVKEVKELIKRYNIDTDDLKPQTIQKWISKKKNINDYIPTDDPLKNKIFNNLYELYQEDLKNNNALDFDDLLLYTVKLFKEHKEILQKYQEKFEYILIDEFQDTNGIQFELINMLAYRTQNIFVVGDQDQSIYSFRGAVVENIDKFRSLYPLSKLILLEENYRSTPEILKAANKVIEYNQNRIKKNLYTNNGEGLTPFFFQATTSYEEVDYVVTKIEELVKSNKYTYDDFAILYRANYLSRGFEDELIKEHIPYVIYGGMSFYQRQEIKDVVSYLRLIVNPNDNFAFKRIVNVPKRKIGASLIQKLEETKEESLFKAIDKINASGIGYTNLCQFKKMILDLQGALNTISIEDFLDEVLEASKYKEMLINEDEDDRLDNVLELKSVISELKDETNTTLNNEILVAFLNDLALKTDQDDENLKQEKVKLTTYHQAKGLEFKVVFMVAMEEGIFPSQNIVTAKELEEERRICYVGITRAKERLYLSYAENRFLFGRQTHQLPSTYLFEMGVAKKMPKEKIKVEHFNVPNEITKKYQEKVDYALGDKVSHKVFGDGLVVEVSGRTMKVAFKAPYGIKTLLVDHPAIKKIVQK